MQLLGSASLMKGRYYILFTGRREEGGSPSAHPPPASFFFSSSLSLSGGPSCSWLRVRLTKFGKAGSRWREEPEWRKLESGWKSQRAIGDIAPRSWGGRARHASGVGGVGDAARNRSPNVLSAPPISWYLLAASLLDGAQRTSGPSGRSLRRGHRAHVVLGTNTAATLPLLGPSVSFGPTSPGPQRRPGRALANTLLQQPDHFAQDFSVSTVSGN